jgi:O-antigen/teichoic acid export membrane protein
VITESSSLSEAEQEAIAIGSTPVGPLGKSAGRGAAALTFSLLVTRLLNFASQIVLGTLLFKEDFGLYAIANSVAAFVIVLQDGGLRTLIVQRGEKEYEELEGPGFWLGFLFNFGAAILLALIAPFAAKIYGQPKLTAMLLVISLAILLSSLGAVSLAHLRMHMRFGAVSVIEIITGIVRYGGMLVGALVGLGPISFVAPLPLIALIEAAAAYGFARRAPWKRSPDTRRWPSLLSASSWLVASSLAGSALYVGSSMAMGLTASAALVGVYYFGFVIVQQTGHLIISTAERVILPVLSRLRDEPERQRSVVLRTLRGVAVLGFSTGVLLGTLFPSVEDLIWRGKWAAASRVVQVLAIAYPLFTLHVVARCVITGWGRFRAHAISVALAGVTLMAVAALAGAVTTDVNLLAWITGTGMVVVSLAYLGWGVRGLHVTTLELAREIVPLTLCAVIALLVGLGVDALVVRALGVPNATFWTRALHDGLRIAAAGPACAIALALSIRLTVPQGLRDCLDVLPIRIAQPARRLLRL